MRDCEWRKILKSLPKLETRLGRILEKDTEQTLLDAIKSEEVFGFIKCDVTTPESMINEFKDAGFLFPPVISKRKLTEDHLSPYMKQRYAAEGKSPAETVIQSYHGKEVLLMTSSAKLFMERGMKVSNVQMFVQYEPGRALAPFVEKVKRMRIAATIEKDDLKATTAKLVGNSCKFFIQMVLFICLLYFQRMERQWRMLQDTSIQGMCMMRTKSQQLQGNLIFWKILKFSMKMKNQLGMKSNPRKRRLLMTNQFILPLQFYSGQNIFFKGMFPMTHFI